MVAVGLGPQGGWDELVARDGSNRGDHRVIQPVGPKLVSGLHHLTLDFPYQGLAAGIVQILVGAGAKRKQQSQRHREDAKRGGGHEALTGRLT
jgi:hypothetical protein